MAPTKRPPRPARGAPKLPPITTGKLVETGRLLERIVETNAELFVDAGARYKEAHRAAATRPLHAEEAAQLAAALPAEDGDRVALAEQLQASSLRAYDEPSRREVLLVAGVRTAPAFIDAVCDAVALIEMPADEFEAACEDDEEALAEAIARRARGLRKLELSVGRERAAAALEHYAQAAGVSPGEAVRLLTGTVWQALKQTISQLAPEPEISPPSQLIDSAESMEGSPDPTSSIGSPGETPAN